MASHSNGTNGTAAASRYHTSSSSQAFDEEAKYAAHNYHPLPVVFAKALGVSVWDPVIDSF
jgi:ornithine--oxo-acid transaminase